MAATAIGKLAVILTANSGEFVTGVRSAASSVKSFASDVGAIGLKAAAFGAALGVTAAAGIAALTHQSMEAIDTNAKLSDRLGITTEKLVGLQHAGGLAGVSSEMLTGAFEKMFKAMNGVSEEGEPTKDAFAALGLSLTDLSAIPADEAFTQIAQRISELPSPLERANAATKIFGKSGQALLPLLMSGAEGIKAAQEEADKLGLSYSRLDAAKVEAANDAMTKAGEVLTGVGNQFAVGLSPYITAATDGIVGFATQGKGVAGLVTPALEATAAAIAYVSDGVNLVRAGFNLLQAGAGYALGELVGSVDLVGSAITGLLNLIPGVQVEWTSSFKEMGDALVEGAKDDLQEAGEAWEAAANGTASKAVGTFFADIRRKADEAAAAIILKPEIKPTDPTPQGEVGEAYSAVADPEDVGHEIGQGFAEVARDSVKGASAVASGSAEAANLIAQFDNGGDGIPERQLAEAKKQTAALAQVAKNTAQPPSSAALDPVTDF